MAIELGYALEAGPTPNRIGHWMDHLESDLNTLGEAVSSVWMTDHFFWDGDPTYEAWTVLAYVAGRFPRVKVGPMVLGQGYRNPALLAKMGASLQLLSGGRLIMAIGAGWKEDEYRAYGYHYPSAGVRIEQLEDTLEIIKRMWNEPGAATYEGRHYSIREAWCEPKPDPVPPIMVGGAGRKTMLLAARFADIWNMPDTPWESYKARLDILMEHCETIGRDPKTLRVSWFGRLAVGKTEADAIALSGGKWTPKNAFAGTPQQIIGQISPFIEAGVDFFQLSILGLEQPAVAGMVLEDVIPALQKLAGV